MMKVTNFFPLLFLTLRYGISLCSICLLATSLFSQSNINQTLSINSTGATADASAQLDVSATGKGLLVPRMTSAQRTAIASPATGLLVFDTDTNTFWFSDNGFWTELSVTAPPEMGSNTTAMPIPDCNPAGVTSTITLNQSGLVEAGSQFVVCLDITHTRAEDMDISLESPDGTVIGLNSDNGSGDPNFTGTCFTTEAVNPVTGGMAPFTGNWIPEEPFSNFIGDAIAGDWKLKVVDDKCSHTGQLNNWIIQILRSKGNLTSIFDGDNDTKIQVEESPDEDIIRFDLGGTEHFVMDGPRLGVRNSGRSVFIGTGAGANDDLSDNQNVAVGDSALYNNGLGGSESFHATANTAIGSKALLSNTIGSSNTANGFQALYSNTTGPGNTANGKNALYSNISGQDNTGIGRDALYSNTNGSLNTANGVNALYSNTNGALNTANGVNALISNTTGDENTANGVSALLANTTGNQNTANGRAALLLNTTGSENTALGSGALSTNTTGSNNTALGRAANVASAALANATAIGSTASVNASNKVRIGNTSVTVIEGQVDWTFPSDARFKFNIHDAAVPGLAFIEKLRPVTYQFDTRKFDEHLMQNMPDSIQQRRMAGQDYSESTALVQTGFLAQEVEQACKDLNFTFSGLHVPESETDNYGLAYGSFVPLLVKAVQEQQREIGNWKLEIENLNTENGALKLENAAMKAQLSAQAVQLDKITAALVGAGIAVEK